ncbi:MAG: hypothetical protein IKR17_07225 [Bacteroidales bacterium]|nr:hypothetical protein [Bacteroidales bacterium]
MATITLKYNARNSIAASLIEAIKKSGVFTIEAEKQSPYDKEFVKKIERSAASEGKVIKTEDLWK